MSLKVETEAAVADRPSSSQFMNVHADRGSRIGDITQIGAEGSPHRVNEGNQVVLFVGADPYSRSRLRLDLEVKAVSDALRSAGHEDRLALEQCWAPTFLDLQHALLRHRPAILHFSGHGTPSGDLALEKDSQFPNVSRRPESSDQRPAEALARMLGAVDDLQVRCVVLNACFSEVQAVEIAEHTGCVVGLFAEVHDSAAIEFARGFYGAIAWGQSIQAAFDLGVAQVRLRQDAGLFRLIASKTDPRAVKLLEAIR